MVRRLALPGLAVVLCLGLPRPALPQSGFQPVFNGIGFRRQHVGGASGDVVAGDLDGDGHLDLVASYAQAGFESWLGGGDGSLKSRWTFATPVVTSENHGPLIALGDLDEDGSLDLVWMPGTGTRPVAWMRGDGWGGFLGQVELPVPGYPTDVKVTDVDGDGHLDIVAGLAVAGPPAWGGVTVLLGDGQGGFAQGIESQLGGSALGIVDLDLGDATGDGQLDLFLALAHGPAGLAVGLGGGRFGPLRRLVDEEPVWSLVASDLDGDGDLDVAAGVTNRLQLYTGDGAGSFERRGTLGLLPNVLVRYLEPIGLGTAQRPGLLLQMQGKTRGQFGTVELDPSLTTGDVRYWPETFAWPALTAADLDGDGLQDVALRFGEVPNGPGGAVFLGGADGGLRGLVPSELTPPVAHPADRRLVLLEDLDGDAVPDAVVVSGGVRLDIHPGQPTGTFGPATTFALKSRVELDEGSSPVVRGDFDGDGLQDLAVALAGGALWLGSFGPVQVAILRGLGGGQFAAPVLVWVARDELELVEILPGDLDGDGTDEIVTLSSDSGRLNVVGLLPGGGWGVLAGRRIPSDARLHACRDVDGDGRCEAVVLLPGTASPLSLWALDWFPGAGLGAPVELLALPQADLALALADADGDGRVDAFFGQPAQWLAGKGAVVFWKGRAAGGFDRVGWDRTLGLSFPVGPRDLDRDGRPELISILQGGDSGRLGVWAPAAGNPLPSLGEYFTHPSGSRLADMDGDGFEDLVYLGLDRLYTSFNLASGNH